MVPGDLYIFQQNQLHFRGAFCLLAGWVEQVSAETAMVGMVSTALKGKGGCSGKLQAASLCFRAEHPTLLFFFSAGRHEN